VPQRKGNYIPAILLLGRVENMDFSLGMPMFTGALLMKVKVRHKHNCMLTDKWIYKM
jgi:hypothetical protein